MNDVLPAGLEDPPVLVPSTVHDPQEDVQPSDSVSNTASRKSSCAHKSTSSCSSARMKTEANLALLAAKQKILQEKHALEEEEKKLRKRREQFQLQSEIAEEMEKLNLIKSQSSIGGKSKSKVSDGMSSYWIKGHSKQRNVKASEFVPSQQVEPESIIYETTQQTVKPKVPSSPYRAQ